MTARPKKSSKKARNRSFIGTKIRRWFFLGAIGIVMIFGSLGLFGENGVLDMFQLKTLHRSLEQENAKLLEKQEELRAEVARLQTPRYIEFLAREQLGLMKNNEFFIILNTPEQ